MKRYHDSKIAQILNTSHNYTVCTAITLDYQSGRNAQYVLAGTQRTLFTLGMVMIMMAIDCVWSFLEVEDQVASEEAIVVAEAVVVTEVVGAGGLQPGVPSTEFL